MPPLPPKLCSQLPNHSLPTLVKLLFPSKLHSVMSQYLGHFSLLIYSKFINSLQFCTLHCYNLFGNVFPLWALSQLFREFGRRLNGVGPLSTSSQKQNKNWKTTSVTLPSWETKHSCMFVCRSYWLHVIGMCGSLLVFTNSTGSLDLMCWACVMHCAMHYTVPQCMCCRAGSLLPWWWLHCPLVWLLFVYLGYSEVISKIQ